MNQPKHKQTASDSERLVEDAAGIEFAAAVDVTESVGTSMEFATSVLELLQEQASYAQQDYEEAIRALSAGTTITQVTRDHVRRRIAHQSEGWARYSQALFHEHTKLMNLTYAIWQPFFGVVKHDLHLD